MGLRHYGGIIIASSDPVTVERRCAVVGGSWIDVTSDFVWSVDPSDNRSLIVEPDIDTRGFEAGYEYRIQPTADLLCNDVTGNPSVAWDAPYLLTLGYCPDLTSDGNVGISDLLALLACWGPVTTPECEDADLTGNGEVGVPDLLILLSAWGPCATCGGESVPLTLEDCWERYHDDIGRYGQCVEWVEERETYYPE